MRFTDLTRSSPADMYNSDAGEPTCTTIESRESSAVIGESGMRGGGDDLSSIIRADQLATKSSPTWHPQYHPNQPVATGTAWILAAAQLTPL